MLVSNKIGISSNGYYCWNIHQSSESHREKYIHGLTQKRKRWMQWLLEIMTKMNIPEFKKDEFVKNVLYPRNIMMCFNNQCWKPETSLESIISEVEVACKEWDVKSINLKKVEEMDWQNRCLLRLLKKGKIEIAYLVNTRILKKRFH